MRVDAVREFLARHGLEEAYREFEVSSATVDLAAQAIGCEPGRIAKSLSISVNDAPLVLVVMWRVWHLRAILLCRFPGSRPMPRGKDEADAELPPLTAGQTLTLEKLDKEQKFTQPPARFSEASLVRELEELGIGRPSTYAAIISTLQDREYVSLKERHFVPTDLGRVVCTQLVEHFGKLMELWRKRYGALAGFWPQLV